MGRFSQEQHLTEIEPRNAATLRIGFIPDPYDSTVGVMSVKFDTLIMLARAAGYHITLYPGVSDKEKRSIKRALEGV